MIYYVGEISDFLDASYFTDRFSLPYNVTFVLHTYRQKVCAVL